MTEEIGVLRNRFEPNSGMGNINTAISVMEKRVESCPKVRDDSKMVKLESLMSKALVIGNGESRSWYKPVTSK